jgi:streptogramin lyase
MRAREQVPPGVARDAGAQVTVVLQNNEAYVSRGRVALAPGDELRVQVVNRDGFDHDLELLGLHDRRAVLGAEDWGRFDWDELAAGQRALAPGESRTVVVRPDPSGFALWVGDPASGEAAAAVVELDREPPTESLRPHDADSAGPLHQAVDAEGSLWVGLAGMDGVVRVRAGKDLGAASRTTVLMPGGRHSPTSPRDPLAPADVAVDGRGIVWTTLTLGNAVARIDPARIRDGSTDGVRVYPLPPCGEDECPAPFPPQPGEPPTRQPLQMEVTEDAAGNALVWFTETGVNRIGLLRVAPDGAELGQTHYTCGCRVPQGLALDAAGAVWFTEAVDNRLGRLVPGTTEPHAAATASLDHFTIPSAVAVDEPELAPGVVMTSAPHSVAVDGRGRVWFTETATGKLGMLDPAAAEPRTSKGMREFALPDTPFGTAAVPADLVVDRAGTVFWADEYGDAIGIFDARGEEADWTTSRILRPVARRSLTDSPVLTPAGDLWVVEHGAGLMTRVAGVSAGRPAPAPAPRLTIDVTGDTLTASGVAEAGRMTAEVRRDGRTVARATAAVADGGFEVAAADWSGAGADPVRAGDRLVLSLHGAHPVADLVVDVAELEARVTDGALTGHARLRGEPVAGSVSVDWAGRRDAPVAHSDGGWRVAAGVASPGTAGTAAWTQSTPGVRVTTVVAVRAPVAAPREDTPAAPGAPAAPQPPAAAPAPAPAATPAPAPVGTPGAPAAPAPAAPAACPGRTWLSGPASRPRVAFLAGGAAELRRCLGAPARRSRRGTTEQLTYASGLRADVRRGRVAGLVITGRAWTAAQGGLRVGAAASTVRRTLPRARHGGGARRLRATVGSGATRAEIRVRLTGDGRRVAAIEVTAP